MTAILGYAVLVLAALIVLASAVTSLAAQVRRWRASSALLAAERALPRYRGQEDHALAAVIPGPDWRRHERPHLVVLPGWRPADPEDLHLFLEAAYDDMEAGDPA